MRTKTMPPAYRTGRRGLRMCCAGQPLSWLVLAVFLIGIGGCARMQTARKPFDVMVEVDFGPANKPAVRQVVQVQPGATPQDATAKVFPLEKGSVCCDPRETSSIGGVAADPATNHWWTVAVNGSKKVSPYKTKLKPMDVVRWEYKKYDQ